MLRWLKRIGIGLAALLTLATLLAAAFLFSFRFSVPGYDGTIRVAALDAKIEIVRDAHAVPHIQAESFRDAAYGLGYAHAQDRLWQMEMARRFVQGRLAELFGASAFGSDALMRTLGLYTAAEDALDHLSPEAREALLAYAEGVNAYISNSKDRWPIEFVLTGNTPPEPWRPADSIAVLAQTIGVPDGALTQTVQAYNAAHTGGTLQSLTPPRRAEKYKPLPITQGPFYAAPMCVGITNTMGGIAVNEHGQALSVGGSIIPGLYVAGAATGGLEGGPEVAYTGGLVKGGVMGLRAAEHLAQARVG